MEGVLIGPQGRTTLGATPVKIGRAPDNQVTIADDLKASRHHAEIRPLGNGYCIVDVGSTSGTLVNGQLIPPQKPHQLYHQDVIRIGDTKFTYETVELQIPPTVFVGKDGEIPPTVAATPPFMKTVSAPEPFPGAQQVPDYPQMPPLPERKVRHQTGALPPPRQQSQQYFPASPLPQRSAPGILRGLGDLLGELFSRRERQELQELQETQLKLFAITRTQLESDDRAFIGKTYFAETGISQNRPEGFTGGRFTVNVQDPTAPIPFDIVVHADKNIEFLHGWHQRLRYIPTNTEPQLVRFPFKVTAEGKVALTINFYREQQWLHTVELEFEGIDQSQLARTIYGR